MKTIKYKCDLCQISVNSFISLHRHCLKHAYGPECNLRNKKTFECDLCKKQFYTKQTLRYHLPQHVRGFSFRRETGFLNNYKKKCYWRTKHESKTEKDIRLLKYSLENIGATSKRSFIDTKTDICSTKIYTNCKKNTDEGFGCDVCGRSFVRYSGLVAHHYQKHMTPDYQCDICGFSYSSMKRFQKHLSNHINGSHDNHSFVQTDFIDISVNGQLNSYISTLHQWSGRVYNCTDCNASFKGFSILANHVLLHTGLLSYTCHMCCSTFEIRREFVLHMEEHFLNIRKHFEFRCSICQCSFSKLRYLKQHQSWHESNKPLFCTQCQCQFSSLSKLITHLKQHVLHDPEQHYCDICMKSYPYDGCLLSHYLTHVNGVRTKCAVCGQQFHERKRGSDELKNHYESHVEEYLLCQLCGCHFNTRLKLKTHLSGKRHRIKEAEIVVVCPVCKKSFSPNGYRQHKIIHTGSKPYVCDVCGKAFRYQSNIIDHMRVHSGERPYKCQSCDASFKVISHLKQHTGTVACFQKANSLIQCLESNHLV